MNGAKKRDQNGDVDSTRRKAKHAAGVARQIIDVG
jgi:hypothetical protein